MRPGDIGEALSELADLGVGLTVSLDLRDVDIVTASTLGKLVALHRSLRPLGGRTVLRNVMPFVREIFRATRLDTVFEILPRDEPAFAANL
jgi:anti-anti-sigma factor